MEFRIVPSFLRPVTSTTPPIILARPLAGRPYIPVVTPPWGSGKDAPFFPTPLRPVSEDAFRRGVEEPDQPIFVDRQDALGDVVQDRPGPFLVLLEGTVHPFASFYLAAMFRTHRLQSAGLSQEFLLPGLQFPAVPPQSAVDDEDIEDRHRHDEEDQGKMGIIQKERRHFRTLFTKSPIHSWTDRVGTGTISR